MKLALYQPEIARNVGATIRVCACFAAELHVIEPCGFPWKQREIARVALDYRAEVIRHRDWAAFRAAVDGRLLLMTTRGDVAHSDFSFSDRDILLLGQESQGVPDRLHHEVDARLRIPLAPGARSLNVSVAGAVGLAEAARQLHFFH